MSDNRGRNRVRHTYVSGKRGPVSGGVGKSGPPTSSAPPSAGLKAVDPPTRIIDVRKPRDLATLPIMISEDDLTDIRRSDPNKIDSDAYEVLLVESKPDTLLLPEFDSALVSTLLPMSGAKDSNDMADLLISAGGMVAAPGMPKPNAVVGIGMAKTGDIIKSLNEGDYVGAIYDASPIAGLIGDGQSGAIDRLVKTGGAVGSLLSGNFETAFLDFTGDTPERKSSDHFGIMGSSIEAGHDEQQGRFDSNLKTFGDAFVTGVSNVDKVGEGFKVIGDVFTAASKFDNMTSYVTSLPGIREVEKDRYYTVYFYPRKGITYVEWKPTADVRDLFSKSKFKNVAREWTEDFAAAAGLKIPAWSRRVKYILRKYGPEGDYVKHYGYSRGGGLATHLGGTGFGTGYFSSYAPARNSRSKLSGDLLHDAVINPMSYMLLLRKRLS